MTIQGVKAGIVGTGFMGWVHAEALRRIGVPIRGVVGSSEEKAIAAGTQYGAEQAFASYDQLLEDDDCQVIHIVTPNDSHFDYVVDALEAGKHVLCEKPLAMTAVESERLVELAGSRTEQVCGVNYNIRFYPLCLETREMARDGRLGELFHVTGSYLQDWLHKPTDYNWRVLDDRGGRLRAVADIGTHWLDLVQFVTGQRITSVCADLQTVYPTRQRPKGEVQTFGGAEEDVPREAIEVGTDDAASILLRFEDGGRGTLQVSQVNAGRKNCLRFEIAGSAAAVAWNSEQPNDLWAGFRDCSNAIIPRDPASLSGAAATNSSYPAGHNEGYDDTFKHCFAAFYQAIEQSRPLEETPVATFADGHHELLLCEAILSSHEQRRWVDVA